MTNREWLNSLSDEDLAYQFVYWVNYVGWVAINEVFAELKDAVNHVIKWLQAEREEV